MKRGFTLIELLAVIVILAIIAVIATPIVLNIIKDSKVSSNTRSAENYLDAVESAIAKENLKGEFNPLTCTVTSDDGKTLNCAMSDNTNKDLIIESSGELVNKGAVLKFNKGDVTGISDFNINGNIVLGSTLNLDEAIGCKAVDSFSKTVGNIPNGNYAYGDEYICDVGDGDRTFFVIDQDGDKVFLILNQNIGNEIAWCGDESLCKIDGDWNNTLGPITAKKILKQITKNWKVDTNLITYEQVNKIFTLNNNVMPEWMICNLQLTFVSTNHSKPYGYWTSTKLESNIRPAYVIGFTGINVGIGSAQIDATTVSGLRPVITVLKSKLK